MFHQDFTGINMANCRIDPSSLPIPSEQELLSYLENENLLASAKQLKRAKRAFTRQEIECLADALAEKGKVRMLLSLGYVNYVGKHISGIAYLSLPLAIENAYVSNDVQELSVLKNRKVMASFNGPTITTIFQTILAMTENNERFIPKEYWYTHRVAKIAEEIDPYLGQALSRMASGSSKTRYSGWKAPVYTPQPKGKLWEKTFNARAKARGKPLCEQLLPAPTINQNGTTGYPPAQKKAKYVRPQLLQA